MEAARGSRGVDHKIKEPNGVTGKTLVLKDRSPGQGTDKRDWTVGVQEDRLSVVRLTLVRGPAYHLADEVGLDGKIGSAGVAGLAVMAPGRQEAGGRR